MEYISVEYVFLLPNIYSQIFLNLFIIIDVDNNRNKMIRFNVFFKLMMVLILFKVKSDMNGDVIPFNAFKIFNIVISITLPQVGNITNDCVDKG